MAYIDQFSAESILVIKKPPSTAPTIVTSARAGGSVFIVDRFICFAYRYEYQNGEFSAVSQFSAPAFTGGISQFDGTSYLNEGMLNQSNVVAITIDTGGPLVVGIQLLFKDMNDPTIKIIESIDKTTQGLGDNNTFTFTFDTQKIFTVLPEYETLQRSASHGRQACTRTRLAHPTIGSRGLQRCDYRTEALSVDNAFELCSDP